MTPRDFCFWLQGFFEIRGVTADKNAPVTPAQVDMIRRHLDLVFAHTPGKTPENAQAYDMCDRLRDNLIFLPDNSGLDARMVERIQTALNAVFVHEIDPSMGPPSVQQTLNQIHHGPGHNPGGATMRC